MFTGSRRLLGWAVVVVGAAVAIVGALADQLGLGGDGPDEFGPRQVIALVVGLALVGVGLVVALWPSRRAVHT